MKYTVFLRSGRIVEVEADRFACTDYKTFTYKFYRKDDKESLKAADLFATFHNVDAVIQQEEQKPEIADDDVLR